MSENKENKEALLPQSLGNIHPLAETLARVPEYYKPIFESASKIGERWSAIIKPVSDVFLPIQERIEAIQKVLQPTYASLRAIESTLSTIDLSKAPLIELLETHDRIRKLGYDVRLVQGGITIIKEEAESADEPDLKVIEECEALEEDLQEIKLRAKDAEEKSKDIIVGILSDIRADTKEMKGYVANTSNNTNAMREDLSAMREKMDNMLNILAEILTLQVAQNKEEAESIYSKIKKHIREKAEDVQAAQILMSTARVVYESVINFF